MLEMKNLSSNGIEILFDGVVGEDITVQEVNDLLPILESATSVRLLINSPGGYVTEGWAIYNLLSKIENKLDVEVIGMAASMGSVLALAGKTLTMRQGSLFMIHRVWTIAVGDANDMRQNADLMEKMENDIIDIYELKSGLGRQEIMDMMDRETWFNAQETKDNGFADYVDAKTMALAASVGKMNFKNVPEILVAKVKEDVEKKTNSIGDIEVPINTEEKISQNKENEMSDTVKEVNVDEIVNKVAEQVLAKIPAGRQIEESNEPKDKLDKWFVDYAVNKVEPKNATTKTTDGYGIPTIIDTDVFKRREIGSFMRRTDLNITPARVKTYSSDAKVTFKANADADLIAEGADYPDNTDSGSQVTMEAYKFGSIYSVTEEVAEDTLFNVTADFSDDAGKALAKKENHYFTVGTGTGEPEGIVAGGTSVSGLTGVTVSGITYDALVDFDESLPAIYQAGSFYMMNSKSRGLLRKLKDNNNRPILQEYNNGLYILFGKPIVINEEMDDFGANKKPMVLGNREGYAIGDRKLGGTGMKVRINENTKNGDTEFRWAVRTDGKVIDPTAFQVLVCPAS